MIILNQLSMAFGNKLLFHEVSLNLNTNTRYALVGANGTGKSTLLKLITGEEDASSGTISVPKDASIGWLKQDQFRYEDTLITDIVMQGKPKLWEAMHAKEKLLASGTWDEETAEQFSKLEETITHYNGYSAQALAEKLLIGLGIPAEYHQKPLKFLSGGFKLRVLLAQTLFQEPDILLLDEPTNHLDIISIRWLEKYLRTEFSGLLVFISHDVEFINRLTDYILDVDYGEVRQYSGQYQKFLEEKKLLEEQKLQLRKGLEDKIADMQKFVDRFKAKASKAKQAQSRMKMIDKIELPDIVKSSRVSPNFNFTPNRNSGKQILRAQGLQKQFREKTLFKDLSFEINRGEKIAIIGENGIGKSTLIKILLGLIPLDQGDYEWGYENHISYFSQDHHDTLNTHIDVLNWLTGQIANTPEQTARKTLGQVLFTKDEVKKDILTLSGGEAARVLLAKMMLEPANILILDEPTNHLDIETTDSLAHALAQYKGTVIFVSHNRDFISKIANRILFISHHKKLLDFKGSFAEFEKRYDLSEA